MQIEVRPVETDNTPDQQLEKIREEVGEFFENPCLEECFDIIQACFTWAFLRMNQIYNGPVPDFAFLSRWKAHLNKMDSRNWRERK